MRIDEMELVLTERGMFGQYRDVMNSVENSSPIKYMIALAETAREQGFGDALIFIGGLGILGNVVNQYGVEVIPKLRTMHDVDAIVNRRDCCKGLASVFESSDIKKSSSIQNKYTLVGKGRDFSGETYSTEVDLYFPGRVDAFENYFGRKVTQDMFGVEVNVLHPVDALKRKLSISCMNGKEPREQDRQDIYNLLAVMEAQGYKPRELIKQVFPGESSDKVGTKLLGRIMEGLRNKDFVGVSRVTPRFMRAIKK